jgi:hypothetical protein
MKEKYGIKKPRRLCEVLWEHTGSNRGPSACKADALNQLSYAPIMECKDKGIADFKKFFLKNLVMPLCI